MEQNNKLSVTHHISQPGSGTASFVAGRVSPFPTLPEPQWLLEGLLLSLTGCRMRRIRNSLPTQVCDGGARPRACGVLGLAPLFLRGRGPSPSSVAIEQVVVFPWEQESAENAEWG
jgi:hypothetical protein